MADTSTSNSTSQLAPALRDRFLVIRQLGRGGYGTVYLAVERRTGETLALKVPHLGQDPADHLRFVRETYALAAVRHPRVAELREVGLAQGRAFYTMSVVPGPTLHDQVSQVGCLRDLEATALLRGLLQALEAIHDAGMVHRDVKPNNVILRHAAAEAPVLVDFGLARLQVDAGLTSPDVLLGTPEFLAPELLRDGVQDHRSDLFAAGMTVRWALTGMTGYEGLRGLALLDAVAAGPAPLPGEAAPSGLGRVVDDLCAAAPAARPSTAAEALLWLQRCTEGA